MILALLLLPATLLAAPAEEMSSASPHGDAGACASCHQGQDPVGAVQDVVATCRSCHPDAHMHPVEIEVPLDPARVSLPEGWPVEGGELTCATCHDEPAHRQVDAYPAAPGGDAVPWLRGGPHASTAGFCQSCHAGAGLQRQDPHHLDGSDPGACAACHVGTPDPGAAPADAALRSTPARACLPCHQDTVHLGMGDHVGVTMGEQAAAALPAALPLDADRTIRCFTCHDVHEGHGASPPTGLGAALQERARLHDWTGLVPAAAQWPGHGDPAHPPLLALPTHDDRLCAACHGEGPR